MGGCLALASQIPDCPRFCRDTLNTDDTLTDTRLCRQGEEAPVLRKCFQGVQRDGELIQVRDTVLLKSGPRKKSLPYVAKISALWEEPESGRRLHAST